MPTPATKRDFVFTVDMQPVPKGRPRLTRSGRAYTPAATRIAEEQIAIVASQSRSGLKPLEGPLVVTIAFTMGKPKSNKTKLHTQRPDLDNLAKLVTDAMNGIVYLDDCQIVELHATKGWGAYGRIHVTVTPH